MLACAVGRSAGGAANMRGNMRLHSLWRSVAQPIPRDRIESSRSLAPGVDPPRLRAPFRFLPIVILRAPPQSRPASLPSFASFPSCPSTCAPPPPTPRASLVARGHPLSPLAIPCHPSSFPRRQPDVSLTSPAVIPPSSRRVITHHPSRPGSLGRASPPPAARPRPPRQRTRPPPPPPPPPRVASPQAPRPCRACRPSTSSS